MTPLRIALNHTRLAATGGVERYVWNLVHYLLAHGHSVDFFAGKFRDSVEHPRFRAIRVPIVRFPRILRVTSFARGSRRRIRREEKKQAYDVVHGFSRTYYQNLYRDGSGCWQDFCEHYLDRVKRRHRGKVNSRANPLDAAILRIERRRYELTPPKIVVAISQFVRDQIRERYDFPAERLRVVYSGVDCERFHPGLRDQGRQALETIVGKAADPQRRFLVFAGNDYRRKGVDLIIEALRAARGSAASESALADWGGGNWAVVIAGADRTLPEYRRRVEELGLASHVWFTGPRQDVPELLAGADVLLLPSYFDAFSNVVGEALASGTPAIVTAATGAAEWIEDDSTGWVMKTAERDELLRCLRAFFAVENLQPLRDAARRCAEAYSWEKHFTELESIYYEVAGKSRENA